MNILKSNKWLFVVLIGVLSITLIGVSYAFFHANILGNDLAGENVFKSGTMELTFTDNDDAISLPNAKPGDTDSKTFTVENTGTLDDDGYTYNIKLTELETTFQQEDLKYKLVEYTDDNFDVEKPDGIKKDGFINTEMVNEDNEMYLAINISRPEKKQKHYYKLTITFEELDVPQDYNQGAIFGGKINVDDKENAKVYIPSKPFTDIVVADDTTIFADESGNIRYAGADPANYVWFNCDDYNGITQENAVSEKHCEKWRIIGVMKNVEKEDGLQEDLIKIVRADSIGNYSWDNKNASTGAESAYGKNDWTTAELMYLLNPNYGGHQLNSVTANNSLYWNSGNGKCSNSSGNATTNCDFTSTGLKGDDSGPTKSMIESVKWNLGGLGSTYSSTGNPKVFYEAERGTTAYTGRPTTWIGKVGLIYPSDYGFATTGGTTGRDACLAKEMYNWDSGQWKTDCANNSWLKPGSTMWTIMPNSDYSDFAFGVNSGGFVGDNRYVYNASGVRPSLYLSSKVKIAGEGGNGSAAQPYIIVS